MGNPWDKWRNKEITDPNAFDEEGLPIHRYCQWCGKVDRGPHTGERWPVTDDASKRVAAADDERTYTLEEAAEAGKAHNVGGHVCPDCYKAKHDAMREESRRFHAEHPEYDAYFGITPDKSGRDTGSE